MKISYNWLQTLINIDRSPEEVSALLTDSGLEVEGTEQFESVRGGLRGLVVGEVLTCVKHPGADRLSVTTVDVGTGQPLAIVCGASNVAAGQKVIVATVGTMLYPATGEPFEIKKSKIRGEVSEGMICAEDEIGLGTSHEGIMVLGGDVKTGTPAAEHFNLASDTILEIGLTPNRSDAASHLGVARDLASLLNTSNHTTSYHINFPGPDQIVEMEGDNIGIDLQYTDACKRYSGIQVRGVTVADSPAWLSDRLRSIGVRPINNIVDITNFVLHELGQPLHAFDATKIEGKIIVRLAKTGEKMTTLDGTTRPLSAHDLVIADERQALCLAGVLGGNNSGVTTATTDIFIESAYFEPSYIRRSGKQHGLKTDASFRFERGTDPEMTVRALTRAVNLVLDIAGGTASAMTDLYPMKLAPYKVAFSYYNCTELIGKEIDRTIIKNIILSQCIEIDSEGSDGLLLLVPRYKTDVTREADVIEEVLRIYGYNQVEPSKHISYTALTAELKTETVLEARIRGFMEHAGFSEMMNLSLTRENYYPANEHLVKVVNPLSADLNVLRASMLFGGLETVAYNINHKQTDLKLFEMGRTYELAGNTYQEEKHVTLFVTGQLFRPNPYHLQQPVDLRFLKSAVSGLFEKCGLTGVRTRENTHADHAYGLAYTLNQEPLAEVGAVASRHLKKLDIGQPVYFARLSWQTLVKAWQKHQTRFEEIGKFPAVRRDLALLIDKSVKYQQLEELAYATEKKLLKEVNLFDIYEDEKLGNKRSYALSFTLLNKEATLTDKQIDGVMEKLIAGYKEKLGAELR